jgi:hypothetical protein
MNLGLTDAETAALERLLSDAIDRDRYPLLKMLKGILAKIRLEPPKASLAPKGAGAETRTSAIAQTLGTAAGGPLSATMKAYSGPPMTLGNAAAKGITRRQVRRLAPGNRHLVFLRRLLVSVNSRIRALLKKR